MTINMIRKIRSSLIMAAAVMTSMDLCQARNDKNTLVPVTLAPSLSLGGDSSVPTSTLKLSIAPSVFPSDLPSSPFPSIEPSLFIPPVTGAPVLPITPFPVVVIETTEAPLNIASSKPTLLPVSSKPTLSPSTRRPTTILPSISPSLPQPTTMPSTKPSLGLTEVKVPLIEISFDAMGGIATKSLRSDLKGFLEMVIKSKESSLGDLDSVELTVKVTINDGAVSQTSIANKVDVTTVDGSSWAYFNTEAKPAPTSEQFIEVLKTHFGFLGDDDLLIFLSRGNITVTNLNISVNNVLVANIEGSNPTVSNAVINSNENSDTKKRIGLIVGLAVGCVCLVAALVILLWQRRVVMERDENMSGYTEGDVQQIPPSTRSIPRNDVELPPPPSDDNASYGGMVSLEDSLYTSATDQVYQLAKTSPDQYDAKRLDKVISNAHNFVASHDDSHIRKLN